MTSYAVAIHASILTPSKCAKFVSTTTISPIASITSGLSFFNKAFAEYFKTNSIDIPDYDKTQMMFNRIRTWAHDRGLYEKGNTMVQYVKLQEEAGELAKALLKDDQPEVIDAIGDMVVVLTNLAHQRGVYIETCIQSAYEVINKRTGKMINGTFVKDED